MRYFLTIAREGNITGAANYLHISQPTLSRQIRDLEEELGQRLFIRQSHSVSLTPEGMILRKQAEEIISMVDKTEAEFRSMNETVGDCGNAKRGAIGFHAMVVRREARGMGVTVKAPDSGWMDGRVYTHRHTNIGRAS